MSTSYKASVFRESALASGLVTEDQLAEAISIVDTESATDSGGKSAAVSDDQLANQLIVMERITWYQAEQLKAGRSRLSLGPYVVTDWIAQGGMGQVFKGVHQLMGREVAIKVLPHSRSTPEAIDNFTREIRLQAQLDHENLVRAYDAGHDGNVYFLVTEYVPGTDLRRLLRDQGPLDMQQAAGLLTQVSRGLADAHARGLVHRDIKPGNILVTPDGHAKLSDLGLAGWLEPDDEDPRAGRIVGTADYISPEQIKSPGSVTPSSDIYSLGCTLYYAVTGKVPYPGGKTRDKARRHCESTPWHPRRFNSRVSEDFVDIIADMMEKDPKRRMQSAEEVIARLEPFASDSAALPTQHLTRSPWSPPPLPSTGNTPPDGELGDTDDGTDIGLGHSPHNSSTQLSGSGDTARSAREETVPMLDWQPTTVSVPPPPPSVFWSRQRWKTILAMAIVIPISMLIGSLITIFFLN